MRAVFVTATDTAAGKTIVTGLIARYFKEKGYRVITQKWIQTGCLKGFSQDIKLHLKIMGGNLNDMKDYLSCVCPYTFKLASSPHLASKVENKKININKIKKTFKILSTQFDFVVVEGIGGALVPLDKKHLVIDIVKDLDLAVLVVIRNKLGAINHSLLTVEALSRRKIKILGIVFNNTRQEDRRILEDNIRIIEILTKQEVLGVLPWQDTYDELWKSFVPIGNRIWKKIGLVKI